MNLLALFAFFSRAFAAEPVGAAEVRPPLPGLRVCGVRVVVADAPERELFHLVARLATEFAPAGRCASLNPEGAASGTLSFRLTVGPRGRIHKIRDVSSTTGSRTWDDHMLNLLTQIRLPFEKGSARGDMRLSLTVGEPMAVPAAPGAALGSLPKGAIDAVVKLHLRGVSACYNSAPVGGPRLGGKVVVRFVIGTDGSVGSAETRDTTLGVPSVESCLNLHFLGLRFPEPDGGGPVIVSYPFLFLPR